MTKAALWTLATALLAAIGCNGNTKYLTEDRMNNGLVVILPGIEGESGFNQDIRRGLLSARIQRALPIHSWGRPVPIAGVLLNQMDVIGNRLAAANIAKMIVQYQDTHPGRPVHLIGHSGGGGIAVFAAESMPAGRKVDGLILLHASISSAYDLTKALSRTKNGIANFYCRDDVGLLVIGTILAGNVDGTHGPAAGAIGFDKPGSGAPAEKQAAYAKLYEVEITSGEAGGGAHSAGTSASFVLRKVSPWVTSHSWPAAGGRYVYGK